MAKYSLEEAKKKLEELKQKSGGGDFMELKEGENKVRIVCEEDEDWYLEVATHYVEVGKDKVGVTCNDVYDGSECYFCGLVAQLKRSKDKDDKALADSLKSSTRYYMNVLDREDKNKLKVLGVGAQAFTDIMAAFADPDWGDLTDPEEGFDVTITKTKTGKGPRDVKYSAQARRKSSPVGVDLDDVELFDIESMVIKQFTAEEQEQLLDGVPEDEIIAAREDAEEEKKGSKKGGKSQTSRKPAKSEEKEEKKTTKKGKEEAKPKRTSKKLTPDEEFATLIERLPLDIPKVKKLYKAWLEDDGTEEGIQELVDKYGEEPEEETEETESNETGDENEDELEKELREKMAKFNKKHGKK